MVHGEDTDAVTAYMRMVEKRKRKLKRKQRRQEFWRTTWFLAPFRWVYWRLFGRRRAVQRMMELGGVGERVKKISSMEHIEPIRSVVLDRPIDPPDWPGTN